MKTVSPAIKTPAKQPSDIRRSHEDQAKLLMQLNDSPTKAQTREWVKKCTFALQPLAGRLSNQKLRFATTPGSLHGCTQALIEDNQHRIEEIVGFENDSKTFAASCQMTEMIKQARGPQPKIRMINNNFLFAGTEPSSVDKTQEASRQYKKIYQQLQPTKGFDMMWYDGYGTFASPVMTRGILPKLSCHAHTYFTRAWEKGVPGLFFTTVSASREINYQNNSHITLQDVFALGHNYEAAALHQKIWPEIGSDISATYRIRHFGLAGLLNHNSFRCDYVPIGGYFYRSTDVEGANPTTKKKTHQMMHISGYAVLPKINTDWKWDKKAVGVLIKNYNKRLGPGVVSMM